MRTVSSLQRPVQLLENSWRSIQAYRGLSQNRQNFTYQNISRRISRLSVIGLNASLSLQHSTTVPALHGLERRPAMEVIRVAKPGTSPGAGGHPVARGGHRRVACASRPLAPVCSSPALADPRRCLVHGPAELRARDWSPRRFGGQGRVRYWCTRRSDGAPGGGREAVGVPHFAPAIYAAPCAARAWPPRRHRCSACEPAVLARAAAVFCAAVPAAVRDAGPPFPLPCRDCSAAAAVSGPFVSRPNQILSPAAPARQQHQLTTRLGAGLLPPDASIPPQRPNAKRPSQDDPPNSAQGGPHMNDPGKVCQGY